jgi:hypothetical protein
MAAPTLDPFASNPLADEKVCTPFSLVNPSDSGLAENLAAEALNVGGAPVNVFKLQGIHECTRLIDLAGFGDPISGGEFAAFPASNAFDISLNTEWRSTQKGTLVTSSPAYLGYDFGVLKLPNGRVKYGIPAPIRQHIATIQIRQCKAKNSITRARIERSDDAVTWYGVDIITLPISSDEQTISFKQSAASRYWRVVPLTFNGGPTDFWAVATLRLLDHHSILLSNIQDDYGFLENRDRAYAPESVQIRASYGIQDSQLDMTRFGLQLTDTMQVVLEASFNTLVQVLGRPMVIGDILEIPSEAQYTPQLTLVRRYLEVTDVAWATDGYTPGWKPTIQRIIAQPAMATQETRDVFGDLNRPSSNNNFSNLNTQIYNIEAQVSDAKINAQAKTQVPEDGEDVTNIRSFTTAELDEAALTLTPLGKLQYATPTTLYTEDALPPNGEPFTEGTSFPTSPVDGAYHRLTYAGLPDSVPPRLYRWSGVKNRWVFLEEDKRFRHNVINPTLQDYLTAPNGIPNDRIQK